jgi:cysteine-rich repeat protein
MLRGGRLWIGSGALALGLIAAPASAERLLAPVEALGTTGPAPALAGVARVRGLVLGRRALADLRGQTRTVVADFPLGADRTAALDLVRFDPFSEARIEVREEHGVRTLAPPDRAYFSGTVRDEPGSRAVVIASPDAVHGFVVSGGMVYPFGPDPAGGYRSYALRDVDAAVYPAPGEFCANDLHADVVNTPAALAALVPPPVALRATTGLVQADVAVDTDFEFWSKFGADQPALDYLASLVAAASAIYQRDLGVRLRFPYVRLWATSADPWAATQATDQLREVQAYWSNPANGMDALAGARDTVHFISGKTVHGGVSYVNALCDSRIAFGVSQVYGSFDLSLPTQIWDVLVVTHELGHTFGSPHTHCYGPPIDRCYNSEAGCYAGPIVPSRGTIMSYCHLLNGGLANMDLVFGDVVTRRIRGFMETASCLEPVPPCGNGILEPGEDCDDANIVSGDGCSSSCHLESCGDGHLDGGEECDDGNTVAGDGCSITCRIEPGCGNGRLEPGEECDDGNHAAGDGCSMSCRHEHVCGDGTLQPGEECDDGNLVSGDGCSTACLHELCTVVRAGQRLWPYAVMNIRRSTPGAERLSLHGTFQLPMPFGSLAPQERGLIIRLENAAGETRVEVPVPGGPLWSSPRTGRWLYKDPNGSANGIRKLVLRDRTRGGLPQVELKVTGRYGTYQLSPNDLPPILTIVLGDSNDGESGACGRHTYGGSSCTVSRNATRLGCH